MLHEWENEEYLLNKLEEYKKMREEGKICSHCINISEIETFKKLKELGVDPYKNMNFLEDELKGYL